MASNGSRGPFSDPLVLGFIPPFNSMSLTSIAIVVLVATIAAVLIHAHRTGSHASADLRVITQLQRAGSKVDKPHEIDFFLYFPNEESARQAAEKIRPEEFRLSMKPDSQGRQQWLVQLHRTMLPEVWALVEIRRKFTEIAEASGGSYDGWGAAVVN